jgi:small basic protein
MALSLKDKIALLVAVLLGTAFGYFSILAGYGRILISGFYGILIVPLIVVYVADQRKILIWQACIILFGICVVVENARLGVCLPKMFRWECL